MQQNFDISLDDLTSIKCKKCSHVIFRHAILLKKISSLVSPDGQEKIIPFDIFICEKCGAINIDGVDREIVNMLMRDGIIENQIDL